MQRWSRYGLSRKTRAAFRECYAHWTDEILRLSLHDIYVPRRVVSVAPESRRAPHNPGALSFAHGAARGSRAGGTGEAREALCGALYASTAR